MLSLFTEEIAQIYQADGENEQSMRNAMESFVQAGEWQKLDDYNMCVQVNGRKYALYSSCRSLDSAATTMFKEAADLAALLGEYDIAVKYYDDVSRDLLFPLSSPAHEPDSIAISPIGRNSQPEQSFNQVLCP